MDLHYPLLQYQCQRAGSKAKNQNITVTVFWQDRIFIFTYTIIYIDIYTYAFIFGYLNKYGPRFTTIMIVEIWIWQVPYLFFSLGPLDRNQTPGDLPGRRLDGMASSHRGWTSSTWDAKGTVDPRGKFNEKHQATLEHLGNFGFGWSMLEHYVLFWIILYLFMDMYVLYEIYSKIQLFFMHYSHSWH